MNEFAFVDKKYSLNEFITFDYIYDLTKKYAICMDSSTIYYYLTHSKKFRENFLDFIIDNAEEMLNSIKYLKKVNNQDLLVDQVIVLVTTIFKYSRSPFQVEKLFEDINKDLLIKFLDYIFISTESIRVIFDEVNDVLKDELEFLSKEEYDTIFLKEFEDALKKKVYFN